MVRFFNGYLFCTLFFFSGPLDSFLLEYIINISWKGPEGRYLIGRISYINSSQSYYVCNIDIFSL